MINLYYDNIVFDLQNIGGISSYWYELTTRLLDNPDVNMKFYQTSTTSDNILGTGLNLNADQVAVRNKAGKLVERFRTLNDWDFAEKGVFHSSYFRVPVKHSKVKVVSTIHDFTHDLFFKGPRVWIHNYAKRRSVARSDAIITVSENTKIDLLKYFPKLDERKIHVIYNGVSEKFKHLATLGDQEYSMLLFVGNRDAYKNFKFTVELVARDKGYTLNIVGSPLSLAEKLYLDAILPGRYIIHSYISTEHLNLLYNQAACLVYPSSYEGFGIPLLEAMRAGCPFLALNGSSIPEVAGDAGYLLRSLDLDEADAALKRIVADRPSFSEKGYKQAEKFSWDKCYSETYNLYNSLI
jgi:mannosyltransferase